MTQVNEREGKEMAGDDEEKELRNHRPPLKTPPSFNNYPKWKSKVKYCSDLIRMELLYISFVWVIYV